MVCDYALQTTFCCRGARYKDGQGVARPLAERVQDLLQVLYCGRRVSQAEAKVRDHRTLSRVVRLICPKHVCPSLEPVPNIFPQVIFLFWLPGMGSEGLGLTHDTQGLFRVTVAVLSSLPCLRNCTQHCLPTLQVLYHFSHHEGQVLEEQVFGSCGPAGYQQKEGSDLLKSQRPNCQLHRGW